MTTNTPKFKSQVYLNAAKLLAEKLETSPCRHFTCLILKDHPTELEVYVKLFRDPESTWCAWFDLQIPYPTSLDDRNDISLLLLLFAHKITQGWTYEDAQEFLHQ